MMNRIMIIFFVLIILTSACVNPFERFIKKENINQSTDELETMFTEDFPFTVAKLSPINIDVNSYDNFILFADGINSLIDIMNRQEIYDIPKIEVTYSTWNKSMDVIETYGPLIGSYNEVILSAKTYEINPTSDNFRTFYVNTASFAIEVILIYDIAVANPSLLKTVARPALKEIEALTITLSRLYNLNKYCPTCYKTIIERAENVILQTLKDGLIEGARFIFDQIIRAYQTVSA